MPRPSEAAIVGLPATRAEVIGDVVGELHNPHANVGEDPSQFGVVAEHRAVLEAEHDAEDAVGLCSVHLVDRLNDADRVGVGAAQMTEGADAGHRAGKVFPDPDGGVHDVDAAGTDLIDHRPGPVVDLQTVDDHEEFPGRAGKVQSSIAAVATSSARGAPWNRVTRSQSVDFGL